MKKVIMGYHPESSGANKTMYFWSCEKFHDWETNYEYAIVQTSRGMQIAKVVGHGELEDEMCEWIDIKPVLKFFDLKED